jgi:hypothetical protein
MATGPKVLVCGIPCRLRTGAARQALRTVLCQVRKRCPGDFARLRSLVRAVRPMSRREAADGTLGRWQELPPEEDDPSTWGYGTGDTPGTVLLREGQGRADLEAVLAHELGHACVRHEDVARRGAVWTEEWAEEFAADRYAYKWGFGRLIAGHRKRRAFMHHGPAPGSTFSVGGPEGGWDHYRLTRNFVVHFLRHEPARPGGPEQPAPTARPKGE